MTRTTTTLRFALLITLACGFLDAYTYLARGHVFANAQTGNVILFALGATGRNWGQALQHLWAILAFMVGVLLSSHIKSGRLDNALRYPMRWAMAAQATTLAVLGFVPATVSPTWVNVPISFVTAMLIGLFRNVGELSYIAVATTGNLMRLVESGYTALVDRDAKARSAIPVYGAIVAAFAAGAVIGGLATHAWNVRAIWLPAGLLAVTLVLFILDGRSVRTEFE